MERWLPIPGYEGLYEVSDRGRVKSLCRMVRGKVGVRINPERILKLLPVHGGYYRVCLRREGRTSWRRVHRLVLQAFVGPCPDGMEGCHNDGDPSNNMLTNLRWDTSSENNRDQVRHGTHVWAAKTHCRRGHPLDRQAKGQRYCSVCRYKANRAWLERQKAGSAR